MSDNQNKKTEFDNINGFEAKKERTVLQFAEDIEKFLEKHAENKISPKRNLIAVKNALEKCNLPLTSIVFQQEVKKQLANGSDESIELEISPPVSITIAELCTLHAPVSCQCDIDKEVIKELKSKYTLNLQQIKAELEEISERHREYKKRRSLKQLNDIEELLRKTI